MAKAYNGNYMFYHLLLSFIIISIYSPIHFMRLSHWAHDVAATLNQRH